MIGFGDVDKCARGGFCRALGALIEEGGDEELGDVESEEGREEEGRIGRV